mgnify:CR=1 FL=1
MLTNGPNIYQAARKESCLTQEQAAERLEVSETTVKAWEQGARVPDNETVAKMVEVYHLPWLALEHAQATDTLGVMPEVTPRPLPMASIALRNRLKDATGRLDALLRIAEDGVIDETERPEFDEIVAELRETMAAIYQVIYSGASGAKKERPEAATSERSGGKACGLERSTLERVNYSTSPTPHASPNFCREGGASL